MADKTITVTIAGDASKLNAALGSAQKSLDATNKHLSGVAKGAKVAAEAFILFEGAKKAAEFLKGTVEAAVENESAMRRVGVAVKNAGENFKKLQDPLDKNLEKMATTTGFVKTDLQESFAKLESVTKNHVETLKLEHDAMNVSAQRNISLAASTKAVMQGYLGSTTAVRRLGVVVPAVTKAHDDVKKAFEALARTQKGSLTPAQKDLEAQELKAAKAADKQATSTSVLDKIHKIFAGAVAARTDTMAGKLAIFAEKWNAIKVKVGEAIIPGLIKALDPLLTVLDKISNLSSGWKTVILAVGGAITTLTAGLLIYAGVVKINTIAQEAWDAAMAANTIGLVVIGVAALVAAFVILYQRSATVRAVVQGAFSAIKTVGTDVFGFFTNTLFPAFTNAWEHSGGVVGTVVGTIKGYFKGVKTEVEGVINLVGDIIHGRWSSIWGDAAKIVKGIVQQLGAIFVTIPKAILTHLGDIAGAAETLGAAIFNGIVGAIKGLPGALSGVIRSGLSALKSLIESFHVSIKTKSYLGVPVPVGMSLGFGGGAVSGPTLGFDVPANGGLAAPGGGGSKSGTKSPSFLHGNLPKVPGTGAGTYTPYVPTSTGGGGGSSGGGGAGSAASKAAKALEVLKAHLQAVADAATKVAQQVQGRMDTAFGKVKDFALKAFDGATQAGLKKLQEHAAAVSKKIADDLASKIKGLNDASAAPTASEAALAALQAGHAQQGLTDATNTAGADLALAQSGKDAQGNVLSEADKTTAVAAAQKAVDDAAYNQRVADLTAAAATERKAANDQLAIDTKAAQDAAAIQQKAADDAAAKDQLNFTAARELKKTNLQAQLDDLQAHLDEHPKLWKKTHEAIMKKFKDDFGPDFKTAGINIGAAYIEGLKQAFAEVDPLATATGEAQGKAGKAKGKVPKNALGGIYFPRPGGQTITVAEAGRPEAVLPLGAKQLGGGNTFHIYTQGIDEQSLAAKMAFQARVAGAAL